jgi:hypothetical protein
MSLQVLSIFLLIPVHDACYHVSHSSQASAFSSHLHALEQVLHGYLGGLGPGLVSIPAIIRSAILYRLITLELDKKIK